MNNELFNEYHSFYSLNPTQISSSCVRKDGLNGKRIELAEGSEISEYIIGDSGYLSSTTFGLGL